MDGSTEPFEFAVTGDVFTYLLNNHIKSNPFPYVNVDNPSILHILLSNSSVFAR